ncbi:MAG: hypothetical protein EOM91_16330 [Sphingobacteriia bacterium]|nr:hypothetical protein [Sphingobacteriia bacterium]NCC41188.1 hypothetical protein [Gammaproteobacteria bacterium]
MRTSTHAAVWTAALIAAVILSGCAGMSDTTRRTTTGAGVGAASGALIGSLSGDAGKGALIGGAVGAAGGYLYDQSQKDKDH